MTDFRQDRSDKFREQLNERGNPHGGRGRRAENNIAEQFETQTGHPLGEQVESPRPQDSNEPEDEEERG